VHSRDASSIFSSSRSLSLTHSLAHCLCSSHVCLVCQRATDRPLPAALRAPELLQHVVPPSTIEVTGDVRELEPAPPLDPSPRTPPLVAFLRPGSTPPRLPRAPRRQGAPSRPLHRHHRPPVRPLTAICLHSKATVVGYLVR
jgi:hypothetical protein